MLRWLFRRKTIGHVWIARDAVGDQAHGLYFVRPAEKGGEYFTWQLEQPNGRITSSILTRSQVIQMIGRELDLGELVQLPFLRPRQDIAAP